MTNNFHKRLGYAFAVVCTFLLFFCCTKIVVGQVESEKGLAKIKILTDVLNEIKNNYVDEDKTKPDKLLEGAIQGMVSTLDPHSQYMTQDNYSEFQVDAKGEFGGLGIKIDLEAEYQGGEPWLTVISPIEDTPAYKTGILAGDKIIKIDGKSTRGLSLMEAVKRLRGPKGTKVTITVLRKNSLEPIDYSIVRDIIKIESTKYRMLNDGVGYIRLTQFGEKTGLELEDALTDLEKQGITALVLDLRFNSGGLLDTAVEVSSKFLPKGKLVVATMGRTPEQKKEYRVEQDPHPYMPMVVMINQGSASASEIVAGALQDWNRAVLIGPKGKTTYGKGSVQTVIPLNDGSAIRLTTAKYYTPKGYEKGYSLHGAGIKPDIEVDIDEDYQRKLLIKEKIGVLPELSKFEIAPEQRLMQDMSSAESDELSEEISPDMVFGATPEKTDKEDKSLYDIELLKAVDILRSIKIIDMGKSMQ